jgi:hypothetical protein
MEVAEHSEKAVLDSRQQVVLQFWGWAIFNTFYKAGTVMKSHSRVLISLAPWGKSLFQVLVVALLVQNFPALYIM